MLHNILLPRTSLSTVGHTVQIIVLFWGCQSMMNCEKYLELPNVTTNDKSSDPASIVLNVCVAAT